MVWDTTCPRSLKQGSPNNVYKHFDSLPSDLWLATSILQVNLKFVYRSAYYFAAYMNFFSSQVFQHFIASYTLPLFKFVKCLRKLDN